MYTRKHMVPSFVKSLLTIHLLSIIKKGRVGKKKGGLGLQILPPAKKKTHTKEVSLFRQSPVHSGSCVSEVTGILKFGAVCVLQRKINAIAGEHPENHALRLFSSAEPSAFLRPEGRKPYRLAFPLQMTLRVRVYLFDIGKSCLHLCLALLPLYITNSYRENLTGPSTGNFVKKKESCATCVFF